MTRKCGIYARFSSDLRRDSSIDDQIRRCREYAMRQGWSIAEDYVIADRAVSAASVAGRDGLHRLLEASKRKPQPFDCLLVDDTSRLARDISDALRTTRILEFRNVSVVAVSQGIDSSQGNARPLLAMHGIMDEQYLTDLAKKVHRGQEGRALAGLTTGGRVYGYDNVPIEDPNRSGKYGRPAVLGVKLEVNATQAAVVMRIFRMYADGLGQGAIAIRLNSECVPGPNGPWSRYTIHEMLRNQRYRGVFVWGRTKKDRDPENGKKVSRDVPASEWRRVDVPEWRIIPEDLWAAVEDRCKQASEDFQKLGGMSRTESGRSYLFSGILVCGKCGGSMVISTGRGKRGYVKYGCHPHKSKGVCDNGMMIRQDRLEEQLLATFEQRLPNPSTLDYAVKRCEEELRKRLAEMERQGAITTLDSLKKQRHDFETRRGRLLEAVEVGGESVSSLTQRLDAVEREISRLNDAIAAHRPVRLDVAVGEVREHVLRSLMSLGEMLKSGDISRAKDALAKHVGKLVLTPVLRDGRPVYKVSGNVSVQPEAGKCRMLVVARDGIEPPTPAFSGPSTDRAKWFGINGSH